MLWDRLYPRMKVKNNNRKQETDSKLLDNLLEY